MMQISLPKFEDVPILSPSEIKSYDGQLLMLDELVVDISNFDHPGTRLALQGWVGQDISEPFRNNSHSLNAKRMLVSLTIGRSSDRRGRGYEIFRELREDPMSAVHDRVMQQIDMSAGVLTQATKLTIEEVEAFITIPKYFAAPHKIMFTGSNWTEMLYKDRFWVSIPTFICVLLLVSAYLRSQNSFFAT